VSGSEDGDTALAVIAVVFLIVVPVVLAVVNCLKGKYWFALIGFFVVGIVGVIGAIRLAKPNSRWARRYDPQKLHRSMNRFPDQAAKIDPQWADQLRADPERPQIEAIEEWPDEHPALWDKTTRRAYKKQHGHWPDEPRPE